jgi:hypothetical protein
MTAPAPRLGLPVPAHSGYAFLPGRNRYGVQGAHLNPLGLFLRTSVPFIWRMLSAFLPA